MLNQVILIGNLVRDPEMKYIQSGKAVGEFTVAVNRKWKGSDGAMREEVGYFDCECWGKTAETVAAHVKRGKRVMVVGRLVQKRWDDASGKKHSFIHVTAERVLFLFPKEEVAGAEAQIEAAGEESAPASQS
jgi:single-strand DNA-binding protein